jgi:hypothetical protein
MWTIQSINTPDPERFEKSILLRIFISKYDRVGYKANISKSILDNHTMERKTLRCTMFMKSALVDGCPGRGIQSTRSLDLTKNTPSGVNLVYPYGFDTLAGVCLDPSVISSSPGQGTFDLAENHHPSLFYKSFNPFPLRICGIYFSILASRVLDCLGAEK